MKRFATLLACFLASTVLVFADLPFRNHRYDTFKVLDVASDHIVFIGNSITNMHAWCEAFDNPKVINRGVSGAVSDETLANLEAILRGKPAKAFLMIGTNDLGTQGINRPERVAANVRHMLNRFQKESPATQLFVQSILPSKSGIRTLEAEQATNALLRELCAEMGATYIDLWQLMMPMTTGQTFSLDGLHPNAAGYRAWCNAIAPYVNGKGATCTYPANAPLQYGGLPRSFGMRVSAFGMQKVAADDILMIGDDVMHGGEWHEIFHTARVKNRGLGWGYASVTIADLAKTIDVIFNGRPDNEAPAQVCLYIGARDANGSAPIDELADQYRLLLDKVHAAAPHAAIHVLSLLPTHDAARNAGRVAPFNAAVKAMIARLGYADRVNYVDCYTPMLSGEVANQRLFCASHLYGMGYARLSQLVAASLNGVKPGCVTPLTDAAAKAAIDDFTARTAQYAAVP